MRFLGGDDAGEEEPVKPALEKPQDPLPTAVPELVEIEGGGSEEEEVPALSSERSLEFFAALDEMPTAAAPQLQPSRPQIQKTAKAAPLKPSSKAPGLGAAASPAAASTPVRPKAATGGAPAGAATSPAAASTPARPKAPPKAAAGGAPAAPSMRAGVPNGHAAAGPKGAATVRAAAPPPVRAAVADSPVDPKIAALRAHVAKRREELDKELPSTAKDERKQMTSAQVAARIKELAAQKAKPDLASVKAKGDAVAPVAAPWRQKGTTEGSEKSAKGNSKGKGAEKGSAAKGKFDKGKSTEKGTAAKGYKKGGGEEAVPFKRSSDSNLGEQHSSKKSRLEDCEDTEGRKYNLQTVVINFANVGATYSKKCLGRDPETGKNMQHGLLDWEGVRRCCRYFKSKGMKIVAVIHENFTATDNNSVQKRPLPQDIEKLCESVEETPRLPGEHNKSADDEMTIKCAHRRNCRFLDNDHYRDWKQQLRDDDCRRWLGTHADLLQMRYYFDKGMGSFDLLEGNMSLSMLAPNKGQAPKKPTKNELQFAPRDTFR